MANVTRQDIIDKMASQTGLTKKDAENALKAFLSTVVDSVSGGDTVTIVGFGSFDSLETSARQGRNPQTGKTITIPASKRPRFKAGKAFKDAVNEK